MTLFDAASRPTGTLDVTYLPRCRACGARHPLAWQPPEPAERCPACGADALPAGETVHVEAALSGRRLRLGLWLLRLGAFFRRLSGRD